MSSEDNAWQVEDQAFLKSDRWEEWRSGTNDQKDGIPVPALQKPAPAYAKILPLPDQQAAGLGKAALIDVIGRRRTERQYAPKPLLLDELPFLLWATQGIHEGTALRRTVPGRCTPSLRVLPLRRRSERVRIQPLPISVGRTSVDAPAATVTRSTPASAIRTAAHRWCSPGQLFPIGPNGDTEFSPTSRWPWIPAMSARTYVSMPLPSRPACAPSMPTIRSKSTPPSAWTATTNSRSTVRPRTS